MLGTINPALHDIPLDVQIRDWVLLPILIVMILFSLLREYVSRLMRTEAKREVQSITDTQLMMRAQLLRSNGGWISDSAFRKRRAFFNDPQQGVFNQDVKNNNNPLAMLSDPSVMMQQQKSMLTAIVPQMLMMGIVSFFFSGFVMVKIPFPLSLRFKAMTQRGIELNSLDVTYVSSFSWYILVSAGLQGVLSLILGKPPLMTDTEMMQQSTQMPGQAMDLPKMYAAEKESLEMIEHAFLLNDAEKRLLLS